MATIGGSNIVRNGLILEVDAANRRSYPGSGTNWNDLSGNNYTCQLMNGPTYSTSNGGLIVLDGTNDYIQIPGNTNVYSTDFTWQSFGYWRADTGTGLKGLWWSETDGIKNVLMAYANINLPNTYMRIDMVPTTYYSIYGDGTLYNGFSTTAGPITNRWLLTTVVKSGPAVYLYWNDAVLMWTVNIPDWAFQDPSKVMNFAGLNGGFACSMNMANNLMYNRGLSTTEISQNYNAVKARFGL